MAKRWLIGLVASIALVSMVGIGFSAFTTNAYVNGTATAGTAQLQVAVGGVDQGASCSYSNGTTDTDAAFSATPLYTYAGTVDVSVSNLVPGAYCILPVLLVNSGSVTLNVTAVVSATNGAMCASIVSTNCYFGGVPFSGVFTGGGSTLYLNNALAPGGVDYTSVFVQFAVGSTVSPGTGTFTIDYVGVAGD